MKRLKRLSVVLVLPAFLLVQSLSKCAPALAEPQSNNQQQDTQELLLKLSHYEKQLLKNGAPAAREKSKAENLAESQQEALVNEILRLRRQVRVLESQKQQTTAPDFEREQQVRDLKQELNNERQRVLGLEKQLEQLREARKMDSAQRQRMSENGAELSNERVVRQKLEKDLKDLQARYEQIKSDAAKSSVYREKYVSTTRNAQQMELELQAKRGIEADNKFLRTELERVKGEKVQLDAETQKAQRIAAEAEKQKKDAAAQLAAKEEEILTWKRQLSMTIEEVKSCQADSARKDQAVTAAGSLEGQLGGLREQLAQAEREKSVCSTELEATKQAMAKMGELRKDLVATKTELLMKDAEINLFGTEQQKAKLKRKALAEAQKARAALTNDPAAILTPAKSEPAKVSPVPAPAVSDVMTIEVTGSKVSLRSGPGEENSPVMDVARGTRLVVEAREGDWFRVVAPTGGRAYIKSDLTRVLSNGAKTGNAFQGAFPAVSGDQPASSGAPLKPPVRVGQGDSGALEPFGNVKLGGRSSDAETLALDRLRMMGERSAHGAR